MFRAMRGLVVLLLALAAPAAAQIASSVSRVAPPADPDAPREVATANERFSHAEEVRRYRVLHDEWLPDSDELTPTMKLKRKPIAEKYAGDIEARYAG